MGKEGCSLLIVLITLLGVDDVNCCCDSDCSSDDVKAFSQCKPIQAHNYDRKFCYTSKLYVENNTQLILEEVNFRISYVPFEPLKLSQSS